MRTLTPAALALALFPAAAFAQDLSCADEFAALDKQIEGSALQAEYRGREASHPMVLQMASGELVDLTGIIIVATPYESWTGSRPVVDKVVGYIAEAKPLIDAGNEEGCRAVLDVATADIKAFDQSDGDPNMMDNEAQENGTASPTNAN